MQQESGDKLGALLVTLGVCAQRDVTEALAAQLGLPLVDAAGYPEFPILEERVSARFLRESRALPLARGRKRARAGDGRPDRRIHDRRIRDGHRPQGEGAGRDSQPSSKRRSSDCTARATGARPDLRRRRAARDDIAFDADVQQLKDLASEAPVIRLVSLIITNALEMRASDIHVEPFENRLIVRYRIDGVLHEVESPPRRFSAAVISRIKIMANLDIAERRLPQDGRIRLRVQGKEIDLRVSTVPTMHGESVVMRILDKGGVALDFKRLGFEDDTLKAFLDVLFEPHGILLVTGPTGCGKTTTLYTALDRLNKPDVKILTVEDPVEYQMPGINQIQVKPQIDLTFANALRSIVRQDPGRDHDRRDPRPRDRADRRAVGADRPPGAVDGAHQRRRLDGQPAARHGRRGLPAHVDDDRHPRAAARAHAVRRTARSRTWRCPRSSSELGLRKLHRRRATSRSITRRAASSARRPASSGRICIMEMLPMTDPLRSLVMRHATSTELRAEAIKEGMVTMYEDGMRKALAGITTFEEVLRVTREAKPMALLSLQGGQRRRRQSPPASSRPRTNPRSSIACATRV